MNDRHYTLPAILLDWLQAAVVIWLLWLGWMMSDLPKGAEPSAAYGLRKLLGLLAFLLLLVRFAWRRWLGNPARRGGTPCAVSIPAVRSAGRTKRSTGFSSCCTLLSSRAAPA